MYNLAARFAAAVATLMIVASSVRSEIFFGPLTDPNASGGGFVAGAVDVRTTGLYSFDDAYAEPMDGNQALRISSGFRQNGTHEASISISISNGENGNDGDNPFNPDPPNIEPPHSAFAIINDPNSTRLMNNNIVRFSFWAKADPDDPILVAPTIEPVVNLEFWTEALSDDGDLGFQPNPFFGDRIFSTYQNGSTSSFIDINGDGTLNGHPTGGPPTHVLSSNEWRLITTEYVVDDSNWGFDSGAGFIAKTISDVEEIRATFFLQEFFGTDLNQGGSILIDQPMLEIYRSPLDLPAEIPNPNPGSIQIDGDFNDDMQFNCVDIDLLVEQIIEGTGSLLFDLNGDGMVSHDDVTAWLAQAGAVNLSSQNAFLPGDANLDGDVDVADFNIWRSNRFSAQSTWCGGDFNVDGAIDVSDFNIWNTFRGLSANVVAVPEPVAGTWITMAFACGLSRCRRRKPAQDAPFRGP